MGDIVFFNRRFLSADEACISVFDRGFTYGDGVFETMRAYKGRVFAFNLHFSRLAEGAKIIGIRLNLDKKYLSERIKKLLLLNNLLHKDSYIRVTITRGIGCGRLAPEKGTKPTVIIIARPLNGDVLRRNKNGMSAVLLNYKRPIPHIKSLNLLPCIMGQIEAIGQNAQEGIFTDGQRILEGTVTNIFISDGKVIKTPPLKDGILPGVTRKLVIELAKKEGMAVKEVTLTKRALKECAEAFLTSSILEVAPLLAIDDIPISDGKAGVFTKRLQQLYSNVVAKRLLLDFS